jgi:hypothetical protein
VTRAALAGVLALAAACDRRPPIASCDDDLRGVYAAGAGRGERWMVLDQRGALEAYPLFPDVPPSPGLEVGPRLMELRRSAGTITGYVRRRYMRGSVACVAKVPVRVTACAGDALELVLGDPAPPLAWPSGDAGSATAAGCTWARPGSRAERWVGD